MCFSCMCMGGTYGKDVYVMCHVLCEHMVCIYELRYCGACGMYYMVCVHGMWCIQCMRYMYKLCIVCVMLWYMHLCAVCGICMYDVCLL